MVSKFIYSTQALMYSHSTVKALVEQSAVEQRKMDRENNYIRGSHFKFVESLFSLSPLVLLGDHVVDDCPENIYRTEPRLNWNKSSFSVDWGRFSMSDLVFKKSWSLVYPSEIWCKSNFFWSWQTFALCLFVFCQHNLACMILYYPFVVLHWGISCHIYCTLH